MSKNFSILRWFGHFFMSLWIYVQILLHYLRFWTYMLQMVYICPRNQDLLDIFLHFFCFMSKHLSKPQILDISCRKTSFMSKIREAQNRDVTCAAPFAGTSKASLFQSRRTQSCQSIRIPRLRRDFKSFAFSVTSNQAIQV